MKRWVPVGSHVEVDVPGSFYLGGVQQFADDLRRLFAGHVDFQGVTVRIPHRQACSKCGRDWEPDSEYPENCGYCGEIDEGAASG